VSFLLGKEAVNFVVAHAIFFFADRWDGLYKANHSLIALGIELAIVAGLNTIEFFGAFGLRQGRDVGLDGVLEVGEEPEPIFELDFEGLIVDGGPGAHKVLLSTISSVLAQNGLNLEFIHQLHFPYVFLGE